MACFNCISIFDMKFACFLHTFFIISFHNFSAAPFDSKTVISENERRTRKKSLCLMNVLKPACKSPADFFHDCSDDVWMNRKELVYSDW